MNPMKSKSLFSILLLILLASTMNFFPESSWGEPLQMVDPKNVCMVNDKNMGKPQIPIIVQGRTYYGCCNMCVGALTNDQEMRRAIDPLSGRKVDKSQAIIGARENGDVLYFESRSNFAAYQKSHKRGRP